MLFAGLCLMSKACFIRNCPKGGKRSLDESITPTRECMRCGPAGLGQCVGPRVCCGPQFGCHISTAESAVCQQEDKKAAPCYISGLSCGERDTGHCVADGVCCDSVSCSIDERCLLNRTRKPEMRIRSEVVQLIDTLLQPDDYD
ncbi:hypothetical protein BsWGS_05578 [Bradybaena similaris]